MGGGQIYFAIWLEGGRDDRQFLGMLPFSSLSAVIEDVRAAMPDTAADLVRQRRNPLDYSFAITDEDGRLLSRVCVTLADLP